jgi:CHASE2 domain-containing sensor protein/tRNA A-37 threonylcarbamoyl transferase component Bud32
MSIPEAEKRPRVGLIGPVVLLLLLVALGWAAGDRMQRLEFSIFDQVQRRVPAKSSDQILLVDTGRKAESLWSDERLPAAIDALTKAGAAVIVPSLPPPASSSTPDLEQLTALLELEKQARRGDQPGGPNDLEALSRQLAGFREQFQAREAIQDALEASGIAVVPLAPTNPRNLNSNEIRPCESLALSNEASDDPLMSGVFPAREMLALPSGVCESVVGAGYAGFRPSLDGVVRETALVVRAGEQVVPTLALAAVAAALPDKQLQIDATADLTLGDHRLSTGTGFSILNRYYHGNPAFETLTVDELLAADFDPALAANRLVLIGPAAADRSHRTSLGAYYPGMLMLATSMSNLLQGDYAIRPAWLQWSEWALLILLAALFVALVPGMTLNAAGLAAIFLGTVLTVAEVYLLLAHGVWAQLGMAAVFSALGIAAIHSLRYLRGAGKPIVLVSPQPAIGELSDEDELDLAFSVLRQQAPNDDTKDQLYRIAVKHGKRREFAKAERVLRYLASIDPDYRGVREKLKKLSGSNNERRAGDSQVDETGEADKVPAKLDAPKRRLGAIRTLGRYEVDKVIGRGAMATVYLGRDPKINRKVAIKTIALADEFSEEDLQAAKEQFMREAESAGRLNHANIIAIYDVGEDSDVAYLAMEYFEGKSLHHFAQQGNLLPPQWVLELGARAAEALHYAHSQNVVHRDIKPANIMYNANNDSLKLTDFGIARLTDTSRTKTGIILGTPSYMSPEQLAGNPVTGQSDLYSLGITLYHLLTGAPPFRADSIPKLMDKIVNERHPMLATQRDDLPASVDDFFDTALAKDPNDRFANGRAMALALRDCCSTFSD